MLCPPPSSPTPPPPLPLFFLLPLLLLPRPPLPFMLRVFAAGLGHAVPSVGPLRLVLVLQCRVQQSNAPACPQEQPSPPAGAQHEKIAGDGTHSMLGDKVGPRSRAAWCA